MKYKTENEMIVDLMPLILGGLIPNRMNIKALGEVPRYSHNDHGDILLLDYSKKECLMLEFKLSDAKGLIKQIYSKRIRTIGIMNRTYKSKFEPIFGYNGLESELEKIIQFIANPKYNWTNCEIDIVNIYYWGYLTYPNSYDVAGKKDCERISLFQLYKTAICNLQEAYQWKLDFYAVFRILGNYAIRTASKHYRDVMIEHAKNLK